MAPRASSIETALRLHREGRIDQAIQAYQRIIRVDARNPVVFDLLAQALELNVQYEAAAEAQRQAVRLDPGNLTLRERLAALLDRTGEVERSIAVWRELVEISRGAPQALVGLARHLAQVHRPEEGLRAIEQAAERYPGDPDVLFELARLYERLGRTDASRAVLDRLIQQLPDHVECAVLMARLDVRAGRLAEARDRLARILATPSGAERGLVHTDLGLVLDKMREYDAAFDSASRGLKLRFDALPENEQDRTAHEAVMTGALSLSREDVARWAAPPAAPSSETDAPASPVFLVGFPRSGTTLLEQMLAAHPRLAVSDELPHLQTVRQKMYALYQPNSPYPATLDRFTAAHVASGRKWYLERISRSLTLTPASPGAPPRRIVDKQPLNTVEMCMARLLFPESPVIYVQRDPRDTVLSVFMQGFSRGMPHLFSLEGTARLYDLFAQVWRHDLDVLGQKTLTVRYEDLVAEPEQQMRRVLGFLDEPWDPAVLNYHAPEHRRYVVTPSYADVTQPVYKRAMGRWMNYRAQLAPVLPVLEPWVDLGGYDKQ